MKLPPSDFFNSCPVCVIPQALGKRWMSILLLTLNTQSRAFHFNDLLSRFPAMTPKILSQRLKKLESLSLVKKKTFRGKNFNKTEYRLTEKGQELQQLLFNLRDWNLKWGFETNSLPCGKMSCEECIQLNVSNSK